MNTKTFAYIRVSSQQQSEVMQVETMLNKGIDERDVFIDKASGKDTNRPQYQALKGIARTGDTIIFDSISRMSRSYEDIKNEYAYFANEGINLEFINEPMLNTKDTTDVMQRAISDIILTLLSAFSEKESIDIKIRRKEGIELSKKEGVQFGRPTIALPENWKVEYDKWKKGNQTAVRFGKNTGLAKATLYRKIKEYEQSI